MLKAFPVEDRVAETDFSKSGEESAQLLTFGKPDISGSKSSLEFISGRSILAQLVIAKAAESNNAANTL